MQKWRAKSPRAKYMRGSSQVQAMCLGGDWEEQARYMHGTCEVHVRYMRGTCEVHAWCKPAQSRRSWRASLLVPLCFRRVLGSTKAFPAGPGLMLTSLVWPIFKVNRVFPSRLLPPASRTLLAQPCQQAGIHSPLAIFMAEVRGL